MYPGVVTDSGNRRIPFGARLSHHPNQLLVEASSTETFDSADSAALTPSWLGAVAAGWGITGVLLLLSHAVYRLAPRAVEAATSGLSALDWAIYVGIVVFFAYTEGYKSFHKAFSPRVVARAVYLARHPVWWHAVLAPAYVMGFFFATRKRKIVTWVLTVGIIGLIVLVRRLPMPWRGYVDGGVIVALTWGAVAIVVFAIRALQGVVPTTDPDVPAGSSASVGPRASDAAGVGGATARPAV